MRCSRSRGRAGGVRPSRRVVDTCFYALLGWSLAFYAACLYLGFHEGRLVHDRGLTPEAAERATPLHAYLLMVTGIGMFVSFWLLLAVIVRSFRRSPAQVRWFVLAGCGALAVGTLQGPVQAFPAVNELLDDGGTAGDVIVNLHAQLNMLGGLMVILIGLALVSLRELGAAWDGRRARRVLVGVPIGMAVYYVSGISFAAVEAHRVAHGASYVEAVRALEPWAALVTVPAAALVLVWLRGVRARRVGDERAPARRGQAGDRARAGPLHRQDSESRAQTEPGRACRVRAADGAARLSRHRLALRGLPAGRVDFAARRSGADVGSDSGGVQSVRAGAAPTGSAGTPSSSGCR